MFKRILVAVDGTATANRGLATALQLAKEQNATLHVLHVVDAESAVVPMFETAGYVAGYVESVVESLRRAGEKIVAKAHALAAKNGQSVETHIVETHGQRVASMILQNASDVRADLIVMGTHGRRGMRRLVMGSDAEGVLREATVPVLLVRSPERKKTIRSVRRKAQKPTLTRKASVRRPSQQAMV